MVCLNSSSNVHVTSSKQTKIFKIMSFCYHNLLKFLKVYFIFPLGHLTHWRNIHFFYNWKLLNSRFSNDWLFKWLATEGPRGPTFLLRDGPILGCSRCLWALVSLFQLFYQNARPSCCREIFKELCAAASMKSSCVLIYSLLFLVD